MKKKMRDENKKLTDETRPLPIILVTFKGQELPEKISIFKVVCKVELYVQRVIQCFQCLRFGHISDQCRNKQPRCKKCGGEHLYENCQEIFITCVHCQGSHMSTDNASCPEHAKQRRIKKYYGI